MSFLVVFLMNCYDLDFIRGWYLYENSCPVAPFVSHRLWDTIEIMIWKVGHPSSEQITDMTAGKSEISWFLMEISWISADFSHIEYWFLKFLRH